MTDISNLLAAFKVPSTFANVKGVKQQTRVEIRRPDPKKWVMFHQTFVVPEIGILQMPEEKGSGLYIVGAEAYQHLSPEDVKSVALHLAVALDGTRYLVPVSHGDDTWAKSLREIVEIAQGTWVRILSDRANSKYKFETPVSDLGAPVFGNEEFGDTLAKAFEKCTIDSADHPVVKILRGMK
jgi:hypothetical protein